MKSLLILLLIGICGFAWQSGAIMKTLGQGVSQAEQPKSQTIEALTSKDSGNTKGMSVHEYAELAKKDPHAYQKFIQSHQQTEERSEVDKLMNFFTRGKYE